MSLSPNSIEGTNSHRRRRSADARLCYDAALSRTPKGKAPATLGSSPQAPALILDDAQDSRTTTPRRSARIASRNCAALECPEPAPRTPEQPKSVNAKDSSDNRRSPRLSYTSNTEEILTPSRVRESHASLCGKRYVYLARLRSHEKECKECVSLQPLESNSATQVHEEMNNFLENIPKLHADCATCSPSTKNKGKQTAADAHKCVQLVDAALIDATNQKLSENEKEGYIYMLSTPEKEGLVKIGRSIHPNRRMRQHKKCTSDFKLIRISGRVKAMKRAEHLIKIDLGHQRTKWDCISCNKVHEEWFKITETEVKIVVNRWINWINDYDPYSNNKELSPLWVYLMGYVRLLPVDMAGADHAARWSHWDRVLSAPSVDDIWRFNKHETQRTKTDDGGIVEQGQGGAEPMELPFRQAAPSNVRSHIPPHLVMEQIRSTMMKSGGNWIGNANVNFIYQYGSGGKASIDREFQG